MSAFRQAFFYLVVIIICLSLFGCQANRPKKVPPPPQRYKTQLGRLFKKAVIPHGLPIRRSESDTSYFHGLIFIPHGGAQEIGSSIEVFTGELSNPEWSSVHNPKTRYAALRPGQAPRITLVRDLDTGGWLATDGHLLTTLGPLQLIEGHVVRIVGGRESPILIAGQPFSDITVVIKNGQPVIRLAPEIKE